MPKSQDDKRERDYAWRAANPERWAAIQLRSAEKRRASGKERDYLLRKLYGITLESFKELQERQGHACRICQQTFDPGSRETRAVPDHDHATGRVRGALCQLCNRGIGHFGDDPTRLRAAADYLEGPQI
jgi:hypothetical protein